MVEVQPGRHTLIPVIDVIRPPEAAWNASSDALPPLPNCELKMEGEGEDSIPVLYATTNIQPGEQLLRAMDLSSKDLLLQHGLATRVKDEDVRVQVDPCAETQSAPFWQVQKLSEVLDVKPGRLQGDITFRGELQSAKSLEQAISGSLFFAARVLSCGSEKDLDEELQGFTDVSTQAGGSIGLDGLFEERRQRCISTLNRLLLSCRGEFTTTAKEDEKLIGTLEGNRRTATIYRLEKKRVLEDVLQLLEEEKEEAKETGGLPFAVTGLRR